MNRLLGMIEKRPTAFLIGLCLFLFGWNLAGRDLWASHEARAAQNAQQILDDGDWLLPRQFDDQIEMQKPPLYYWFVASFSTLTLGEVNAWSVRLPAALAGLLTVLLVYHVFASRNERELGLLAGVILATAMHFIGMARVGRIDMVLTLVITALLLSCREQPRLFLGSLLLVMAILLKGLIGLVLPIGVLGVWYLLERDQFWRNLFRLTGMAILGIGLAAPWFLYANERTGGEFLRTFIWHHHVERAFGGSDSLASYPIWYYLPRFLIDFLPWSPLLFWMLFRAVRNRELISPPSSSRFAVVWFVVVFGLLSFSRFKRSDYLLPLYPAAAIWLAGRMLAWKAERIQRENTTSGRRPPVEVVAIGVLLAIVGMIVHEVAIVPREGAVREQRAFAEEIRRHTRNEVLLFRVESHLLAFHLRRPIHSLVEWHHLNDWLREPEERYFVTREEFVEECQRYVTVCRLEIVLRSQEVSTARPLRPLVLMRRVSLRENEITRCPPPLLKE